MAPLQRLSRIFGKLYRSRVSWSLVDQGIVSAGNFIIVVLFAHSLPPADLGLYAVLFGVIQFANAIQAGLVGYPMTIFVARQELPERDVIGMSFLLLLPLTVLSLTITGSVVWLIDQKDVLIPVLAMAFFWQVHNYFRRSLLAQLRHKDATWGDAISYLGQCGAAFVVMTVNNLTLEKALYLIAVTSAAAIVVQYIQVAPRYGLLKQAAKYVRECWVLGIWVACSNVTNMVTMQSIGWILAWLHGFEATAALRAVGNVVGVTHPLMNGIRSIMMPSIAHAHRDGLLNGMVTATRFGAVACCLVLPLLACLLIFPEFVLELIYGKNQFYSGLSLLLQIFALNYMLRLVVTLFGSTLNGLSLAKKNFFVKISGSACMFGIGVPMAAAGGIIFAGISYILSNFVQLCIYVRMLRKELHKEGLHTETILREALGRSKSETGTKVPTPHM